MMSIRLIVGLGNPGDEYELTRHNAGAWFVEQIARQAHLVLRSENKFLGRYVKTSIEHKECHLLIPSTFMNRSGGSVASVLNFYKILPEEIIVAHDELDMPPGAAKLKQGGGHAGHNGLRDIIAALGTSDFLRLRLGIGHPGRPDKVSDYVLSRPNKADEQKIYNAIDDAIMIVPDLLAGDISGAMKRLHTEKVIQK
ncbi:MAG: aminoacyl-tRNA hydrolase [Legionellales bacterium]|nr:aminoacyl-tRNA hydrolase [Legionellales bacterium]